MTDPERSALLAAVAKALPPGAGLPLALSVYGLGDDDVFRCASVDGYALWVGNGYETFFVTTGRDEAECVARMYAAVGVTP